ncbi:MAG TPA: chemotaxis protein CheW [Myxococcaceae bacterium]|nr:chemotaxis protein CheW [Myxococcaceae bacterium]
MRDGEVVQLCTFFAGAYRYALDVMRVEEVLEPVPVTPVFGAPDFVEGVVRLRDSVLPVVALSVRMGTRPSPGRKPKFLIARVADRRVALRVDGLDGVARVSRGDLRPVPGLASPGASPYVLGVYGPDDAFTLLLNLKAVLRADPGGRPHAPHPQP